MLSAAVPVFGPGWRNAMTLDQIVEKATEQ